jgi:hypothetical protein
VRQQFPPPGSFDARISIFHSRNQPGISVPSGKIVKAQYHREITINALSSYFSLAALQTIIAANLGQDAVRYQFGHDHYHYDNNSFAAGDVYVDELGQAVVTALEREEADKAREQFGRLVHTVQDLYAHSNYVSLWLLGHPGAMPQEIDPQQMALLHDPRLRSGRVYFPLEALSFISLFKPFVIPFLPRDSHAWMNMDDPSCKNFEYAFAAAVKRSTAEFLSIKEKLSPTQVAIFTGKAPDKLVF